jgi:hypothetical protein
VRLVSLTLGMNHPVVDAGSDSGATGNRTLNFALQKRCVPVSTTAPYLCKDSDGELVPAALVHSLLDLVPIDWESYMILGVG